MKHRRQSGFTLIELMVTIAILGILSVTAVPMMQGYAAASRVTAATNELLATMAHARGEAIRRGTTVTITANGGDWRAGWTSTTAGGVVVNAAGAQSAQLQFGNALNSIAFASDGTTTNTGNIAISSTSSYTSKTGTLQVLGSGKVVLQ